ncbi:MAG: molybdate ABC transporter permease subunit [Glaciecola sp.]|jgi:molybdate transport system permease protein
MLSTEDFEAVTLTLKLASIVTAILLVVGTPIAWWLAKTRSKWKSPVYALIAMPLILPPSVLGFYLLLAMGPNGPIGFISDILGLGYLPFTFNGLVMGSVIYSIPFMVQPLSTAFEAIPKQSVELAATLGADPLDRFFTIIIPASKTGFLSASILTFAHTVGEFGVVLMIGGSIPSETRVVSVQIYDHVESLQFSNAHALSAIIFGFAVVVLFALLFWQQKSSKSYRS